MKIYMISFDKNYKHYASLYASFLKYEDTAVDYYSDGEVSNRNLTHPNAVAIKEQIGPTISGWKNPFRESYIWIKGELLDLLGAMDAMDGRDKVMDS